MITPEELYSIVANAKKQGKLYTYLGMPAATLGSPRLGEKIEVSTGLFAEVSSYRTDGRGIVCAMLKLNVHELEEALVTALRNERPQDMFGHIIAGSN
jgi:hypothetical protein